MAAILGMSPINVGHRRASNPELFQPGHAPLLRPICMEYNALPTELQDCRQKRYPVVLDPFSGRQSLVVSKPSLKPWGDNTQPIPGLDKYTKFIYL